MATVIDSSKPGASAKSEVKKNNPVIEYLGVKTVAQAKVIDFRCFPLSSLCLPPTHIYVIRITIITLSEISTFVSF